MVQCDTIIFIYCICFDTVFVNGKTTDFVICVCFLLVPSEVDFIKKLQL